jgi:hypothetical protein
MFPAGRQDDGSGADKTKCPVSDMIDLKQCNGAFFIAGVIQYGSVQTIDPDCAGLATKKDNRRSI